MSEAVATGTDRGARRRTRQFRTAALALPLALAVSVIGPGAVHAAATRAVTIRLVTHDGRPVVGMDVIWYAVDGSSRGAACKATDGNGETSWLAIPIIEIRVTDCTAPPGSVADGATLIELDRIVDVPSGGPIVIDVGEPPPIVRSIIVVRMPDGTPVWNASVTPGHGTTSGSYHVGGYGGDGQGWWACPQWDSACPDHANFNGNVLRTDADGVARYWHFDPPVPHAWIQEEWTQGASDPPCYVIRYNDGELEQKATASCSGPGPIDVELPYMPAVRIVAPPVDAVPTGSEVEVTVKAVDGSGDPIPGQAVSIGSAGTGNLVARGTAAARCTPRLSGRTNSAGRVTFVICADRTRSWRADGRSLVAARPFTVLVRRKGSPSAPRSIKATFPDGNTVVMTWRAPLSGGTSGIKRYETRWSPDGGITWTPWRSTALVRRSAPRTLVPGRKSLFQVRAVNAKGGGATSKRSVALPD